MSYVIMIINIYSNVSKVNKSNNILGCNLEQHF